MTDPLTLVEVLHAPGYVSCLDFVPGHSVLLAGNEQGEVHVFRGRDEFHHFASFRYQGTGAGDDAVGESERVAALAYINVLPRAFTCLIASDKLIRLWNISTGEVLKPKVRTVFSQAHECRIHSVSVSYSKDQFMSCDDLRVYLWNVDHAQTAFCIADYQPARIQDLSEVLLSATFHRTNPSLLAMTSTAGFIRIGDLRIRATAMPPVAEMRHNCPQRNPYTAQLASVTGADFSEDEHLVFARDIQSVAIWDLRSTRDPLAVVPLTQDERQLFLLSQHVLPRFTVRCISQSNCVTGGFAGEAHCIAASGESQVTDLRLTAQVCHVAFDADRRSVFAASAKDVARWPLNYRNGSST